MYSVVLLMAVTAGGETADFGRRGGCHGCYGGCYGCGGGYSYGCYGCSGYGGCCGGYSYGCGGYGGCCGGYSYGGCGGGYSYGCGGGTSYGCYGGASYGCGGGVSYGCGGGASYGAPAYGAPQGGTPAPQPEKVPAPKKGKKEVSQGPAPATMIVSVPADASVLVDGKLTQSTSSVRTFASPDLQPGQGYAYTLKAEFSRDGKKVSVTKRVPVTAGETVNVDLTQPVATAVASK